MPPKRLQLGRTRRALSGQAAAHILVCLDADSFAQGVSIGS